MKNNINLFPVINAAMCQEIEMSFSGYKFYYTVKNEKHVLDSTLIKGSENLYELTDYLKSWNKEYNNICFSRTLKIKKCKPLFGPSGIATENSKLGIAVIWFSSDSRQRGAKSVVEFTAEDKDIDVEFNFESEIGQFRGLLNFQTIVYLSEFGTAGENEKHLANISGTVLGELDKKYTIVLDGIGSFFPIYDYEAKGEAPLWNVICDWEDPSHDKFSEKVQININKNHVNYSHLRDDDHQLLIEVMSSALEVIILRIKSNQEHWRLLEEQEYEPGSVLDAVHYFIQTLHFDIDYPEKLSSSIRLLLEKRMGVL